MSKEKLIFIAIAAIILVLSFFGWLNIKKLLYDTASASGWDWLFVCLIFIFIGGLFGVLVLLIRAWQWPIIAFGLVGIAFLVIFGVRFIYLLGLALSFILVALYTLESFKEKKAHIRIVVSETVKPSLISVFTVVAIMVALAVYFSPIAQGLKDEIKIPRPLFDIIFNSMSGILGGTNNQVQSQASNILKVPGMGEVDLSGLDMESVIGKVLTPEARETIYEEANRQLNFAAQKFKKYLPYGVAVGLFFALKAISFIFVLLAGLVCQLFFIIAKSVRLVSISKETVEREVIKI